MGAALTWPPLQHILSPQGRQPGIRKRLHTGGGKGVLRSSGHAMPGVWPLSPAQKLRDVVIPLESSWKMKSKSHTEALGQIRLSLSSHGRGGEACDSAILW